MRNYIEYYARMGNNIKEKIEFIINELKTGGYEMVIDFGCADGQTTRALADLFPHIQFIGYDYNEQVIAVNNKNNNHKNIIYSTRFQFDNVKTMVFFSSVLHEIYSFYSNEKIRFTLNYIFSSADTIAIRDMFFTDTKNNNNDIFLEDKYNVFLSTIKETNTNKINAHYLMKKDYVANWIEELKENYFATNWGDLIAFSQKFNFSIIYDNQYMNEYLISKNPQLKKYTHTTHRKLILKNFNKSLRGF
ncbi:class I SAM-dependent methyltransferase [bacterium]|nr:class I SAM-dependent methyltransferase [bacterium]